MLRTVWRKIEIFFPRYALFHYIFEAETFLPSSLFHALGGGGKKIKVMPKHSALTFLILKRCLWGQPAFWWGRELGSCSACVTAWLWGYGCITRLPAGHLALSSRWNNEVWPCRMVVRIKG